MRAIGRVKARVWQVWDACRGRPVCLPDIFISNIEEE